ncbi:hypothetical protein [Athalassotoga saccharophila]|uniref:hypothetical protein n=1 Tax=Athalassotoga saccharophila TaxID=1441386 RepID=UPI00137A4D41|nr:hypothetical protein [Athalassotoga saccharophila]BBJ27862.1 hypothetical protein ATHSA_0754 [Athalassotoga saccharophila]
MSEKSRRFVAEWLFNHEPEFVVINSKDSVEFFRYPRRISLKFNGTNYDFSVESDSERFEVEIGNDFTALCPDKYKESSLLIVDSVISVEMVERFER